MQLSRNWKEASPEEKSDCIIFAICTKILFTCVQMATTGRKRSISGSKSPTSMAGCANKNVP